LIAARPDRPRIPATAPAAAWRVGRAVVAAALLALTGAACRDGTAPGGDVTGRYVLRTVRGEPLPAVLASGPSTGGGTETLTLLASAFHFGAGGAVRYVATLRTVSDAPARDSTFTTEAVLSYQRDGARVAIAPSTPCPPTALCGGYFTGRLVGDRLEVVLPTPLPTRYQYEAER
jgi:hypothetical protein